MRNTSMFLGFLSLGLVTTQAAAMSMSVQAQLIGANGSLDPEGSRFTGPTTGFKQTGTGGVRESVTSPGVGVNVSYKVADAVSVSGELSWINFDEGLSKPQYQDTSVGINGTYDFYRTGDFAVYGLGGASFHRVDSDRLETAGEVTNIGDADLYNYDLSIGTRTHLGQAARFDVAYRYSDSFVTDNVPVNIQSGGSSLSGQYRNLALRTNAVIASVGYLF